MHRRLFNVMATQVRPGSTKPERHNGPQQSLEQMRRRPAHSIRAREFVSHTQAECKAAISTRDPKPKISLGMQGRPCKCLVSPHLFLPIGPLFVGEHQVAAAGASRWLAAD